ncbi:lysophospholipid acyltransferase family protein [Aeromicrobium sp. REDSEA-S38_B2]|uniref:lysophospholipid acyltransferase family protein n=1 Tax=Aeromicrobium sp. REDSEA-S38_B2 TaxID=1811528 RepID=UPI000AACD6D0|nr:lysophospholipid acyltransferase family protein [Aeromicrobium sp. REDSEA-S38_B2]
MRDYTYPTVIVTAKTLFKVLGMKFQTSGTEHIPREGGAILAANHIGYVDFVFDGLAAQPSGRLVRFMAKKEAFDHAVGGPLMRSFHHIEVDRDAGQASYDKAVEYARSGEIVGIFPEATISRSMEIKELKTGAVRMAAEAGVPLIPMVTWGTQLLKTKDHDPPASTPRRRPPRQPAVRPVQPSVGPTRSPEPRAARGGRSGTLGR